MKVVSKIFDEFEKILKNKLASLKRTKSTKTYKISEERSILSCLPWLTVHLKAIHPRISALLQNLVERKEKGWKKHLPAADGPKKLKDEGEEKEVKKLQNKVMMGKRDSIRE